MRAALSDSLGGRVKRSEFIGLWRALLAAAALAFLAGCQTPGSAGRHEIRATLDAYRQALNGRSFERLEPLLSDEIRVDGMPDELSRAGLRAGMQWPPSRIGDLQILKVSGLPEALEARVALYMERRVLMLRIAFDSRWRIRSIDDAPLWKSRRVVVKDPFVSPFVVSSGLAFVRGKVNGRSGYLLLDTGSSDLLLNTKYFSPEAAQGMPGLVATVHGLQKQPRRAMVKSLQWGNLVARDIRGQLHEFSQMEAPGIVPLLGAIGFEQLRNSVIAFDWKGRTVEVSASGIGAGHPAPRATVPFSYFLHAPVIPVRIGERTWPMVLDSGAQVNLLPRLDELGQHFCRLAGDTTISDGGQPGERPSPLGIVDRVAVGGILYREMPFAIFEVPYLGGNGILGSPVFQNGRVEIDYPRKRVSLW